MLMRSDSSYVHLPKRFLLAGIGFFAISLLGVSLLVVDQMLELSTLTDKLYKHPFTVSTATMRIRDHIALMHLVLEQAAQGSVSLESSELEQTLHENQLQNDIRIVKERFLGDPSLLREMETAIGDWLQFRDSVMVALRAGKMGEAMQIIQQENEPLTEHVAVGTDAILQFAGNKAAEFHHQATRNIHESLALWGGVVLFLLVFGSLIVWRLLQKLHRSEAAHRVTHAQFQEQAILLDNIMRTATDLAIVATSGDLIVRLYNPVAEKIFGLPAASVLGKSVAEIHEQLGVARERMSYGMEQVEKKGFHVYERHTPPEQGGRIIESRVSAILDNHQNLSGYLLLSKDVTEQRHAMERVTLSEKRLRTLMDAAQDAIFVADAKTGLILDANRKAGQLLQCSPSEIIGLHQSQLHPQGEQERYQEMFQKQVASGGGYVANVWILNRKNERIPVEINAGVVDLGSQVVIQGIFRDVTERQRTEQSLRWALESLSDSQARLQGIMDHSRTVIFLKDTSGRYRLVNRRFEELFGVSNQAIQGKTDFDFFPESEAARFRENDLQAMRLGSLEVEEAVPQADGLHIYLSVKFSLRDPDGSPLAVCGIATDITERKHMEEALRQANELLEERVKERTLELERSNRDLQQFAYVASHDLQEPLRQVSGFAQLLERRYKGTLDEKANQYINYMVEGSRYMQDLIEALLRFSRVNTHGNPMQRVSCNHILEQVLGQLALSITASHAEITHDTLPEVNGDPAQLAQMFQNLLGNAIKFRGMEPPRIHITAEPDGLGWRFTVQDNGIGIEERHQNRIFTIFQRLHTRVQYPGTGIGLAICKRIAERHGGDIWVQSEAGKGSQFIFTVHT